MSTERNWRPDTGARAGNTGELTGREEAGAAAGGDRPADGSAAASRPSLNNRQDGVAEPASGNVAVAPADLPHAGLRPLSVEEDRRLRDEAVLEKMGEGPQARPWYAVVSEWRDWYHGYQNSHIEYENAAGEVARAPLENSYQPNYGKRYYAKLKDFERGVERTYESLTTVMLTLSASSENAEGGWRCPADHMRDIMDGYDAARKQLHQVLSGRKWEYARVWEPHQSGYGHLHVAVFVEDQDEQADLAAGDFEPVMRSHVENCRPAGWDAHRPDGGSVSVRDDVGDLGCYVSEYIGIFGEEALDRPMTEQMFYATCWATNTRRVDFSNGAHELMRKEQFRRETGLRPEDRGGDETGEWERWDEDGAAGVIHADSAEQPEDWTVRSICSVEARQPSFSDPTTGGVDTTAIAGRSGVDEPAER